MLYSLPNGKVGEISLEKFLDMSDEEFNLECQGMMAWDYGSYTNDPFYKSNADDNTSLDDELLEEESGDDESLDIDPDLLIE